MYSISTTSRGKLGNIISFIEQNRFNQIQLILHSHCRFNRSSSTPDQYLVLETKQQKMSKESNLQKLRKRMSMSLSLSENEGDRLYGRSDEESILMNSYYASLTLSKNSPVQTLLINGDSGLGKTRLAEVLGTYVKDDDGFFIRGKFDQSSFEAASLPYSGISNALGNFCVQLEKRQSDWERIVTALKQEIDASETTLLCEALPSLRRIIQGSGEVCSPALSNDLDAEKRQYRLNYVLKKFIAVMTSTGDPIIFLLDDMQWSDSSSLDLIKTMAANAKNPLIFVFTYRSIPSEHPFAQLIESLETNHSVTEISLRGLTKNVIHEIVCEVLGYEANYSGRKKCDEGREDYRPLSNFLCRVTNGNPLYVRQQLISLVDKKLIYFDDSGGLAWDLPMIEMSNIVSRSLQDMAYDQIKMLPTSTQLAVQVCACIGSEISYDILGILVSSELICNDEGTNGIGTEVASIGREVILPAINDGLLTESHSSVSFIHDSFQSAAYSLLKPEEKAKFHWKLGQVLKSELLDPTTRSSNHLFIVANQLSRGCEFAQESERMEVMQIFLRICEESKMVADFSAAFYYYGKTIEELLCNADWIENYRLCCDVYLDASLVALWSKEYHNVDRWLNVLSLHTSGSVVDQLKALLVRANWMVSTRGSKEAVGFGLKRLGCLVGIKIIRQNNMLELRTIVAMTKTRQLMKGYTTSTLLNYRRMSDEKMAAALRVLNFIALLCPNAFPQITPLVCFKIVNLNLRHGISSTMPVAIAWYGVILIRMGFPLSEAFKYGQTALSLQDALQCDESKSQVAALVHGMINPFVCNVSDCVGPLYDGHNNGLQTGDVRHSMICAHVICLISFHSGNNLKDVAHELDKFTRLMKEYNTFTVLGVNSVYQQIVTKLTGRLCLSKKGVRPMRSELMISFTDNNSSLEMEHAWTMQAMIAYIFGDYKLAWHASEKLQNIPNPGILSLISVVRVFFAGMTAIALTQTGSANQSRIKKVIKSCRKTMSKLSTKGSLNISPMKDLLEAEYASFFRKSELAEQLFPSAIAHISESLGIHIEAIAWERFGHHYLRCGNEDLANDKLRMAKQLYAKWGAHQKSEVMTRKFKGISFCDSDSAK